MDSLKRVRRWTDLLYLHIERQTVLYLAVFCLLFLEFTALRARAKLLWYDELFTVYLSRLPDLSTLWSALKDGADQNPPLIYIVTRAACSVLGENALSVRLPALLGFLLMSLCTFRFAARRCSPAYALVALLFPSVTMAYMYAYEGRPYGMVLGFAALALVFWQSASAPDRRIASLVGLALSTAAALLSHCYAIVLLVPLGVGETIKSIARRRLDWPVWFALGAALPTVVLYLPLFGTTRGVSFDSTIMRPHLGRITAFYQFLLEPASIPILLLLVIVVFTRRDENITRPGRPPIHEVAAALGMALVPVVVVFLAMWVTRIYFHRYCLLSVIGISILLAWVLQALAGGRKMLGVAAAGALFAWFIVDFGAWFWSVKTKPVGGNTAHSRRPGESPKTPPEEIEKDLPFVASNGLWFWEANHYASPDFASRLVFLMNTEAAIRYTGTNQFDPVFWTVRKWFPLRGRLEDYETFLSRNHRFLVYGPYAYPNDWLIEKLLDDGAEIKFRGEYGGPYGDALLLEVTPPNKLATTEVVAVTSGRH